MGKNLTTGSVFRTIVTFALPYLLSYFLQTLYGMADLFIAGQFIGIDGITAVANGSQVLYMLTVVIVGLAMGATVTIGRAVGANRLDRAAKAIGNVITLFAGIALALTVVLLLNVHNIISLIGVPVEAVEGTAQYLLYRHPVHRRVQHYQLGVPWDGRFEKPHVFHCGCMLLQHRVRLPVYGLAASWSLGRGIGHHTGAGHQCDRDIGGDSPPAYGHQTEVRRSSPR